MNEEIIADKVMLVGDESGTATVSMKDALEKARAINMDLVEVSPDHDPPVVKILDYSKFRFDQIKRNKESKKKQHKVHIKEIKMRPGIDSHDYNHKIRHAREFIDEGNKVKFTVTFRGREVIHSEIGFKVANNILSDLSDISQVEKEISRDGKNITLILSPQSGKN